MLYRLLGIDTYASDPLPGYRTAIKRIQFLCCLVGVLAFVWDLLIPGEQTLLIVAKNLAAIFLVFTLILYPLWGKAKWLG